MYIPTDRTEFSYPYIPCGGQDLLSLKTLVTTFLSLCHLAAYPYKLNAVETKE